MQKKDTKDLSVVMIGATGAVGTETVKNLLTMDEMQRLTLLGRRPLLHCEKSFVEQKIIDIFDTATYKPYLPGHEIAICTLGVGQPSKMSREQFLRIDKDAVIAFAKACKSAGVQHFSLLASVAIHPQSKSFYLRSKGELVEELQSLCFERLSIFQPSMILTPTNRYGLSQAITLKVWPLLTPLLMSGLRKYRGISVERLGRAIAKNIVTEGAGVENLVWDDFMNFS
jgi:uncharacterized protein YbjT (DUF2867 family)